MSKRILLFIAIALLTACAGQSDRQRLADFETAVPNRVEPHQDADSHERTPDPTAQLQVVLVPSEVIVGANRFAVGLIDPQKGMIHDAQVHLRYFDLRDPSSPTIESESDAVRLQTPDGLTTIFADERDFNRAGDWGVQVEVRYPDGSTVSRRIGFRVVASSPTLKPGARAPSLKTRTAADANNDLKRLSSAATPNPAFYHLTLAQALASGKPTVLLFATPAFCQTRMCGPAYEVIGDVAKKYGAAANFIHVEVFTGLPNPAANKWQLDPAMMAFGLQTEPWVFLIDKAGTIVYRVEGLVTEGEIEQHLKPLLAP